MRGRERAPPSVAFAAPCALSSLRAGKHVLLDVASPRRDQKRLGRSPVPIVAAFDDRLSQAGGGRGSSQGLGPARGREFQSQLLVWCFTKYSNWKPVPRTGALTPRLAPPVAGVVWSTYPALELGTNGARPDFSQYVPGPRAPNLLGSPGLGRILHAWDFCSCQLNTHPGLGSCMWGWLGIKIGQEVRWGRFVLTHFWAACG